MIHQSSFYFQFDPYMSPYGSHNNHLLSVVSSMEVYPMYSDSSRYSNSAMEDHSLESYSSIKVHFNYLDNFNLKSVVYLHRSSNNFIHRSLSIGSHSFHFLELNSSRGQKWWQALLGREISCSQWEGPSMHSRCLALFIAPS